MIPPKASIGCTCDGIHLERSLVFNEAPVGETRFPIEDGKYWRCFYKCRGCTHFFASTTLDLERLYESTYSNATYGNSGKVKETFERIIRLPKGRSDNFHRVQRVKELVNSGCSLRDEKPTALDIGAGLGVFSAALKMEGWDCVGVDPDPSIVDHLNCHVGIQAIQCDYITDQIDGKFDFVSLNKVLEHVEEPIRMLSNAKNNLAKDGLLYLEVPDGEAAHRADTVREEFFIEHLHVFSKQSTIKLLENVNLRPLKVESILEPSGKYTIWSVAKIEN